MDNGVSQSLPLFTSPTRSESPVSIFLEGNKEGPDEQVKPKKKRKLSTTIGQCTVSYEKQGGKPLFHTTAGGTRLATACSRGVQTRKIPDTSLQSKILANEIICMSGSLFGLDGLQCYYTGSSVTLDFSDCHVKAVDKILFSRLLGVELPKVAIEDPDYLDKRHKLYPERLEIDLATGKVECDMADESEFSCDLGITADSSLELLDQIHLLLLQRMLGESLYSHHMYERLQASEDPAEKAQLLSNIASADSRKLDDPERLGFRLKLCRDGEKWSCSLSEINHEVAYKVWRTSNPKMLLIQVNALLNKSQGGVSESELSAQADATQAFPLPFPPHALIGDRLEQERVIHHGLTFLDDQGRLLRRPLLKDHTFLFPPAAPTRLSPPLAVVVRGWKETGLLPNDLHSWCEYRQPLSTKPVDFKPAPAPEIDWQDMSSVKLEWRSSNGIYRDKRTGECWHIRFYDDEERARNEVLTVKLYQAAGAKVAERHFMRLNGKACTVSPKLPSSECDYRLSESEQKNQLCNDFMADAWLASWSISVYGSASTVYPEAVTYRTDCSGSLRYRAAGGLKGSSFGPKVQEIDTLLDRNLNYRAWLAFGDVSPQQKLASAARVIAIPRTTIESLVRGFGPRDRAEQDELIATLVARQQDIARRFPGASSLTEAVHIIDPSGYHLADEPMDIDSSTPEGDRWQWLCTQDCQDAVLTGDSVDGLERYLHFEHSRIAGLLASRFPGIEVELGGESRVIATAGREKPLPAGRLTLKAKDSAQSEGVKTWLESQGLGQDFILSKGQFEITVAPNCFYRRLVSSIRSEASMASLQENFAGCQSGFYPQSSVAVDEEALTFDQAMSKLDSLRDKVGVITVYGDSLTEQPCPTTHLTAAPWNIDCKDLIALDINDSGEGLYCSSKTGGYFNLKLCRDKAVGNHEVLMVQLAKAAGQPVVESWLVKKEGQSFIARPVVHRVATGCEALKSVDKQQRARLLLTAAWLGNTEIIGRGYDHSGVTGEGELCSMDWSSSGYYLQGRKRKRVNSGGEKAFFGTAFELDALRVGEGRPETMEVFGDLTDQDIEGVMPEFLAAAAEHLADLVSQLGPTKDGERSYLLKTLADRLLYLRMRFADSLPRITQVELQAVAASDLYGTELLVASPDIEEQKVRISHLKNDSGEKVSQVCLKLTESKLSELAKILGLGKSHNDLYYRLRYFLDSMPYENKKVTRELQEDLEETLQQANTLYAALCSYRDKSASLQATNFRIELEEAELAEVISKLANNIERLNQLITIPVGDKACFPDERDVELLEDIPQLPDFIPTDPAGTQRLLTRAVYEPRSGGRPVAGSEKAIKGGAAYHRLILEPGKAFPGLPPVTRQMVLEFHGPDCPAASFEGTVRLMTEGQDEESITCMLDWLKQFGLDCRRPDSKEMQRGYDTQLRRRADIAEKSALVAADKPGWEHHTQRENCRVVRLLPESCRLPESKKRNLRPVHLLSYSRLSTTPLKDILKRGASLQSFVERVNTGGPPDSIGNPTNVFENAGNLVFAELKDEKAELSRADLRHRPCIQLTMEPRLFDRVDHQPVRSGMRNQSWYVRHNIQPLEEWAARSGDQSNFAGSVSLFESTGRIMVETEAERAQALRALEEEFDTLPSGYTPKQLLAMKKTSREQYDEIITPSEEGKYSDKLVELVKAVGYHQFSQLVSVNPHLLEGQLNPVSLEGIHFNQIHRLKGMTITSLRNTTGPLWFTNCKVANADLEGFTISGYRWTFSPSEDYAADIDFLSGHLEKKIVENEDEYDIRQWLGLLDNAGRQHQCCMVLEKYSHLISTDLLMKYVESYLGQDDIDYPALIAAMGQKVPTAEIVEACLQCASKISLNQVQEVAARSDIVMLCQVFAKTENQQLQAVCFSRIRKHIQATGNYSLLWSIRLQRFERAYQELTDWVQSSASPELYPVLIWTARRHGVPLEKRIELLQQGYEQFPGCDELENYPVSRMTGTDLGKYYDVSALELFGLGGKVCSVSLKEGVMAMATESSYEPKEALEFLHILNPVQFKAHFLQFRDNFMKDFFPEGKLDENISEYCQKKLLEMYQAAIEFLPGDDEIRRDFIAAIRQYDLPATRGYMLETFGRDVKRSYVDCSTCTIM